MKRFLATLGALALIVPLASTQTMEQGRISVTLAADYDLDTTTYTALYTTGQSGKILNREVKVERRVKNGAGTTDITSFTASAAALDNVEVNDILIFHLPTPVEAVVVTDTDANNVVVSPAVDLSAYATTGMAYGLRNFATGTAADDGAIDVTSFQDAEFHIQVAQAVTDGAGLSFQTQCRGIRINPIWNVVDTWTIADAAVPGAHTVILDPARYEQCRVMSKITTADDGNDLTTNKEKVGIVFTGYLGEK